MQLVIMVVYGINVRNVSVVDNCNREISFL